MAIETGYAGEHELRFSTDELFGALGDSITVLPIVVALGALTPASLPHVLLLFGVFQVVWGVVYGMPLSVEPMKALAGLAIAGALSFGELLAGGLLAGIVLLAAGSTGTLARIERYVGEPVVRGVQLAVALLLARTGLELGLGDPTVALGAVALAGVVFLLGYRNAAPLAVLGAGAAYAALGTPVTVTVPSLALFPAGGPAATLDALSGAAGQLAMTVGNAAVATAALCADLFDRDVAADDLATSMGAMTLASVPLGGLPMCHGSGGLAGKHAFGARTGGANVVLGVLYALAALVSGVVLGFPTAALGVLLIVVAVHLGRNAARADARWLTVAVGLVGLFVGVGAAFLLGVVADRARVYLARETDLR